ncbi:hypothetical protein P3X46_002873 [Hevea brasiliensis]|uniref:Uncharacterized protein n=2 Tax=Hevea brasiliensis TaxID=3981 RepID=A0ABQ9N721_HEVBR|nr:hypothetical protein P3X46_002860 [Hevea brasiliensis]KAJ9187416.1 hypothetical protein P3X46_002873 [Hevea brasiliensis]
MSRHSCLLILMFLLLFFFTSADRHPNPTSSFESSSRNHRFYRHHFNRPPPSCDSFPHKTTRSLCIHFQRMNTHRLLGPPPPTPPSPPNEEIDPRYGVEKRLVPSGPNPLHN